MTQNQIQTKIGDLRKERRGLMIDLNSPATIGSEKAAIKLAIAYIDEELGQLGGRRSGATTAAGNKTRTYNPKTGKLE
jgi:methylaspartate ammonia-lyase